jgi:hypothetical protein
MSMIDPALPGAQIGSLGDLRAIEPAAPRARPTFGEVVNAAFENENTVVSSIDALWNGASVASARDPEYDAWKDIQGTPYEDYWRDFADSPNAGVTAMLKSQIDDERENRQILQASGGFGVAASFAASILDPTILVPVGGEIKVAAAGGRSVLRSAGSVALAGGAGTAISEGLLQGSQVTRTTQESAFAIGTGALLSGFLGAGAAALLNRVDKGAYEATLKAFDTLNANTANPPARPTSAGAMAVDTFGLEDLSLSTTGGFGKAINVVAEASKWVGPNMRLQFSPSPVARRIAQQLNEGSLFQRRHDERGTLGPAVETLARGLFEGRLATANKQYEALWLEFKKATKGMSRRDFNNAVGIAMRRNDESADPFVTRAAQLWRKTMYEPYLNDAINVGSLPADVSVETAASYLNRVWNRAALVNGREKFLKINADYFGKNLARNFETDTEALAKRKEKIERQVQLLKLTPAERAAALTDVEARGKALEAANVDSVNRVSEINDLRAQLKEARKRGDAATVKLLAERISAEQAAGGERLLGYLADRARLRDERKRVDMNIAGVNDRLDRTLQALVDLEEKNIASLERLIARGRVLEREIQRLDPAKAREKVSALRNSFIRLAEQADRALDRQAAALAKMDEASAKAKAEGKGVDVAAGERDARARAMIDKEIERQQKRSDQMNRVAERLDAAETLDVDATLIEVKSAVDELVKDVSRLSMQKGEKAARLKARLERLDPKKVQAKEAELREAALKAERDYNGRWVGFQDEDGSFTTAGRDIGSDVYDKLIGLDSQVGASQALSNIGLSPLKRGPLKDRTYQIPDELIEEFLESDIQEIAGIYGRTMAGDVELTRAFGSADMAAQIDEIVANYRELKDAAGAEATGKSALAALPDDLASAYEGPVTRDKVLEFLDKSERADLDDIKATRDLVRGTYKAAENASTMGGIARNLGAFNYLRLMGGVVLANLTETVRPAMVVGWKPYLAEGIGPLMTNLKAVKMSVADAQQFGVATERWGQNRLIDVGEIGDPLRRGTPFDRMAGNLVNTASRWSGLVYFTDAMKGISSVLVQNRIINSILDGKNDRLISFLEISPANAERIAEQFRLHGQTSGNTRIANLDRWTDGEALRAYGAAVRKDVNSIIVTKAAGDVPLFANEPMGKILLQFRSYMLASHQKVLLRGLQESKTNFLSGMMGMTVVGMMAAYLRAWRGGDERRRKFEEAASNPGYLIGEGLDLSGIFAIPFEAANTTEKLLKGVSSDLAGTGMEGVSLNPIKTPLLLGGKLINPDASLQGSSTRFANVDPEGALLGPSANLLGDVARGPLASLSALATGQAPTEAELRSTKKLVPFAGYPGIHEMLQVLTEDSPYLQNAPDDQ